jgi:hypothetical protein
MAVYDLEFEDSLTVLWLCRSVKKERKVLSEKWTDNCVALGGKSCRAFHTT